MTDAPTDPEEKAVETVEEKRDLFERIAEADLPISEDIERILEIADGGDE
ncbi:hypothetical protein HTZ84_05405 [Haloterrigena sp. SYSU A558-1]|uniref:Uncharacterized protein n=1 Tax=Haloterrigena gelatinilytica TaxID=2741724 RepID=A0ABX2LD43_9EURY|nr:hypothetical protein [Haloterrigena gelatinilytica]NUC71751.1 hypothetical protein [Haloterrigena gelatinilytica]